MSRARRPPGDGDDGGPAQGEDTAGTGRPGIADEPERDGVGGAPGRRMFACPHCGHELSMFEELRSGRAERIAVRCADLVGSWRYLLFLLLAIVAWCLANAFMQLFQPHPSVMLGYLGTALTVLAVLQGPLILLTQRRESDRDRARDIAAFYIAQHAEADLHSIGHAVNVALEERGRSGPTDAE